MGTINCLTFWVGVIAVGFWLELLGWHPNLIH